MCSSAEWHENILIRLPVIVIHTWGKEFIGGYFCCLTVSGVPSLWSVHSVAMGLWRGRMSVQRECMAKQRLLKTGSREACPQTEKGAGISRLIPESLLMTCLHRPLSTFYFPATPNKAIKSSKGSAHCWRRDPHDPLTGSWESHLQCISLLRNTPNPKYKEFSFT